MEIDSDKLIKNRVKSLYRDTCEAEKQEGFGLSNSAKVIADELDEFLERYFLEVGEEIVEQINLDKTEGDLGDRGYMQYIKSNIRKLSDLLDIQLDDDDNLKPTFNITQNQNVTQVNSQVFENMISNINKLDIQIDTKKEILELVNNFKDESTKDHPDTGKLKELFKKIGNKSKEAAAMLSYWATITGTMDQIIDQIHNLPK